MKTSLYQSYITLALLFLFFSCSGPKQKVTSQYLSSLVSVQLLTPKQVSLNTYIALSEFEQMKGLSGTKPESFIDTDAMLFFNENDQTRSFWMPDTYFNLDIFFLDKNFKVLFLERDVPHHPGRENLESVYRTGHYNCRHVLELKHSSVSQSINVGDKLEWGSKPSVLDEIKSKAHLQQ